MRSKCERLDDLLNGIDVEKYEFIPEEGEGTTCFSFHGPDGIEDIKHAIILKAPIYSNSRYEIQYINIGREEKERLFNLLDAELHDTTSKQLDDENWRLKSRIDKLKLELEQYQEAELERNYGKRGIA